MSRASVRGTRPAGTRDESEAALRVREMFSHIAPRYDFLNHLLSFSFDRLWRWRTARRFRHLLERPGARVLDLCCGTGDLALALARVARKQLLQGLKATEGKEESVALRGRPPGDVAGRGVTILGADFVHAMLLLAQRKTEEGQGFSPDRLKGETRALAPEGKSTFAASAVGQRMARPVRIFYLEADALELPFLDSSLDLITAAFGFRNLANYERGLRELLRLLKPGGEIGILEFAEPRDLLFAPIYRFYFNKVLPRIGGAISGSRATYAYLPSSVSNSPLPEELTALLARAGFADVRFELWTGGIVALHTARRA